MAPDMLASFAGNSFVALIIIFVVPAIFLGTVILTMLFKKPFILGASECFLGVIFASVFILTFGGIQGIVIGAVLLIVGFLGLAGKLNLIKNKMCCLDPTICNYTCFVFVLFIIMSPLAGAGVAIGAVILIFILIFVAIFGGGEIAGAAEMAGGAAETGGVRSMIGQSLEKAGAEGSDILGKIGPKAEEFFGGAKGKFSDFLGKLKGKDLEEGEDAVEEMEEVEAKKVETESSTEEKGAETNVETLQGEYEQAEEQAKEATTPEGKKAAEERAKGIKSRLDTAVNFLEKAHKHSKRAVEAFSGSGEGGFFKKHFGRGVSHIGKILIVLLIIMLIFGIPYLMSRAATGSAAQRTGSAILDGLWGGVGFAVQGISNAFAGMADWFTTQFQTCELGPTGVPCKALKIRSCEPFCVSPTGEKAWKGFSIKRLSVVPETIYDYQGFSVLGEFVNEGEGVVQFTTPGEPQFSFFQEGGKSRCQFGLAGWLNWDGSCTKIFPISQDQEEITRLASGKCAEENGELAKVCELEPGEVTQLRWFGFKTDSDKIRSGATAKPTMTITIPYTFIVPNDLVGSVAVQTFQEQLTASTTQKNENKIINKINRAYSPPGPLMMAMGTAEDQVVSTIPSTFLIQFANKGKGTVSGLQKQNIKIYLPPDFRPIKSELCDFTNRWGRYKNDPDGASVDKLDKTTKHREYGMKTEYEAWNPGPGYENYLIYEPKRNQPAISSSSDINSRTLLCVLQTPKNVDKVKAYDFKMRVVAYEYQEQKTTGVTIIGTALSSEGIVDQPKTRSFSLLGTKGDCARGQYGNDLCNDAQTVSFDKPYYVKEINAKARYGGDPFWCGTDDDIKFTAQKSDKGAIDLGTVKGIKNQETKGVKKSFTPPVSIQSVKASIINPDNIFSCPYVDDVSATITYVTPPVAKFVYKPTSGKAPLEVKFDPFESKVDGKAESYTWEFGDGKTEIKKTNDQVLHTYRTAGTYKVVLTIKDQNGLTDVSSASVTVAGEK